MPAQDKIRLIERHKLHWTGLWTWLLFATAFFALEGLLLWAFCAGPLWLIPPLVLVLAHIMHSHLLAFHEAAHGTLCPNRPLNEGLGIFIGVLSFMPLSLFRAVHHCHHAYLTTERDEELWPFVLTRVPRWARCLAATCELLLALLYTPLLFLRSFLRPGSPIRLPGVRRRIWAELTLIAIIWVGVFATVAWFDLWQFLLVLYVAPAALAGSMQSLRKYIEHMGLMGSTIVESTRSVMAPGPLGRFLAFTLFNEPYHGVHHKYPRLPQTALPEFADLLSPPPPERAELYPNYRRAFAEMVRTLGNPRVGSQWLRATSG
jgi:fatty acid desaturase